MLSMTLDVLPYANAYSAALSAGNQQLGLFDGCLLVSLPACPQDIKRLVACPPPAVHTLAEHDAAVTTAVSPCQRHAGPF